MPASVFTQGQVDKMLLPEFLEEGKEADQQTSLGLKRTFRSATEPELRFTSLSRRRPLGPLGVHSFDQLFEVEPHTLSTDEWTSIESKALLTGEGEGFELERAWTADVNGKRVLMYCGTRTSKNTNALVLATVIDHWLQLLLFVAPPKSYLKYVSTIEEAFHSIKWKNYV